MQYNVDLIWRFDIKLQRLEQFEAFEWVMNHVVEGMWKKRFATTNNKKSVGKREIILKYN